MTLSKDIIYRYAISFDKKLTSYYLNRAIVAFANSGGGHIIVGVDNDGKVRYSR
ncbi:hypothetical protein C4E22_06660 [ANME-1 cluster archaeon AG-394-G06]|nr:hypothetical protein [ANME-1 cluster archaeon AG-394-G06]